MSQLMELDHAAPLTPGFRAGTEELDLKDYVRAFHLDRMVDIEPVRLVLDETMARYEPSQSTEADSWLAPRLHYVLRLTRREAANLGLWRWLGCVGAPDYVRWRWGGVEVPTIEPGTVAARAERFTGPVYKQALARLWWMAELFRDGSNYTPAAAAMMNQDIPNNLFRMDIAHHRPTALAAVQVLNDRSGRVANALAKAVNAAATTLPVDVLAPDQAPDTDAMATWVHQVGDVNPTAYFDKLPPGPDEAAVPSASVERMRVLLVELLAEAPVRGHA